ncbi:MAG: cysteine hydrolase [Frankiales bacterium]|nr:cysteine hydrolase [Frankiales bacterium]
MTEGSPSSYGHVHGSLPYPWPYDGDVSAQRFALLLMQQPTGSTRAHVDALRFLAADVGRAGGLVIAVAHRDAPVLVHGDVTVRPPGRDAFYATGLDDVLRQAGRDRLVLAGWHLEIEVHSTLRSANDRGYECLTLTDACLPADPALAAASSSMIQMSGGIFGAVGTSHALVAALTSQPSQPALQEELA